MAKPALALLPIRHLPLKPMPPPGVLGRVAWIHPAGHRATDGHEPRQVRKEAAISDSGCVVDCFRTAMVQDTRPKAPGAAFRASARRLPPSKPLFYRQLTDFRVLTSGPIALFSGSI